MSRHVHSSVAGLMLHVPEIATNRIVEKHVWWRVASGRPQDNQRAGEGEARNIISGQ